MDQESERPASGDDLDWEAVGRYLAGESSPAEAAAVRRTLESSPNDAAFVALLDKHGVEAAPVDVEAALERVHGRLDALTIVPLVPRRRPMWLAPSLAAAAAVILIVGAVFTERLRNTPIPDMAAARTTQVYATLVGERDSIQLGDGTLVVLGAASALEVLPGFNGAERVVSLRGEAYFNVHHDEARPFVVRAGATMIRDVGTQFSVRNRVDGVVRVAVTEGVVAIRSAAQPTEIELRVGDVAIADTSGRITAQRQALAEADTAWKRGQLVFSDAPMSDVRDGIRRWYGIDLHMDTALVGRHVTATFRGEPVDRVLDVIALTLGARVNRQGDTANLRAGPSGSR